MAICKTPPVFWDGTHEKEDFLVFTANTRINLSYRYGTIVEVPVEKVVTETVSISHIGMEHDKADEETQKELEYQSLI